MDILNKEKLKEVLERWKGHPSITGLMEKFSQLQTYTNKNYKNLESYTKQKIKESKYQLVELPYIDVKEDPVRPELDLACCVLELLAPGFARTGHKGPGPV